VNARLPEDIFVSGLEHAFDVKAARGRVTEGRVMQVDAEGLIDGGEIALFSAGNFYPGVFCLKC
jgi:hypothetical protein